LGEPVKDAKNRIESENPDLTVVLVRQGELVTLDYSVDRVRIFYDEDRNVAEVPCVG
jgi:hypothetical protein